MNAPTKANRRVEKTPEAVGTDADLERFLAENHSEVAAKLEEARASIARGEAVPLEPLHVLLRDARGHHKATR